MADQRGYWTLAIPIEEYEAYVAPMEKRILEQTGIPVSKGLVARRLIALGFEADTSRGSWQLSDGE